MRTEIKKPCIQDVPINVRKATISFSFFFIMDIKIGLKTTTTTTTLLFLPLYSKDVKMKQNISSSQHSRERTHKRTSFFFKNYKKNKKTPDINPQW